MRKKDGCLLPETVICFLYRNRNREERSMRNLEIEREMFERAVELIQRRYPTGWGGAGVVHTAVGHFFTSVSIDTANASAVLCIETVSYTHLRAHET